MVYFVSILLCSLVSIIAVSLVRRRNKNHASDSYEFIIIDERKEEFENRKKALEEWKKKRKKKVIIGRGDVHDDEVASISVFICENCGYTVRSEPQGFYVLKSEAYYNFRCKKCKNIVNISAEDIEEMGYVTTCPLCDEERLSFWNPIEGHCPRCKGKMRMEKTT